MTEHAKTPLYEVGTFEQHEAGFHAFYRTLNKDNALKVLEVAKDCHSRLPEYDSDGDFETFLTKKDKIDVELHAVTGNKFNISSHSGWIYAIKLREVNLDD